MAQNIQQGEVTPVLYNFYGKQYDYNDLAKSADQGINDYLLTVKRGDKDQSAYMDAYHNIMSGIKDGSITFEDGRFHDTQGRYKNADKKDLDYYGIMANYIYNAMGKSNEYKPPKDKSKIEWKDDSVKLALMRQLYNSDSENLTDFLDLDEEKNGVRGLKNRTNYLANALQSIVDNWDNTFQGYSDSDKAKYAALLGSAAQSLRDGKIDPGDYLALSKAVGGVNFRDMMAVGKAATPTVTTASGDTTTAVVTPNYRHTSLVDDTFDQNELNTMSTTLSGLKPNHLVNILRNSFYNPNYRFGSDSRIQRVFGKSGISSRAGVNATLNALYSQGYLQQADPSNPNLYYIPGLRTKKGTGWVWDKSTNDVKEMPISSIPYAKNKLDNNLFTKYVPSAKRGGILYAADGASAPNFYDGLTDYDKNNYSYEWQETPYGMDKEGNYTTPAFGSSGTGLNQNRYRTDTQHSDFTQGGRDAARAIENSDNYKAQTDKILADYNIWNSAQDKSGLNEKNNLFLRYTKWYDSQQQNAGNRFWNGDKLNTSWTSGGKNYYGEASSTPVTDVQQRIRNLRNDQMVSYAHNNFRAKGTRYFYKDTNGTVHYVDPKVATSGKYKLGESSTTPTKEGWTDWTDIELTGLANQNPQSEQTSPGNKATDIDRTDGTKNSNFWKENGAQIRNEFDKLAPDLIAAQRLNASLRANKKIADIQKRGNIPYIQKTYERYSPVLGKFGERQAYKQQGNQIERESAIGRSSDMSQYAAQRLEGQVQAMNRSIQGDITDNNAINQSKKEALARQEDNAARRTDISNKNMYSIISNIKDNSIIDAQHEQADYTSKDQFLQEQWKNLATKKAEIKAEEDAKKGYQRHAKLSADIAPYTQKFEYDKQLLKDHYTQEQQKIQDEYQTAYKKFTAEKGEDALPYDQDFYKTAREKLNQLNLEKTKAFYEMGDYQQNMLANVYNTAYNNMFTGETTPNPFKTSSDPNAYKNQNWYKILNGVQSNKRGGKLIRVTQHYK